ncbi:hypothetical protein [uncultured Jatrophihabitans sp.]|uniref:hypothetical protein n=1 Tax=uncultured Jatrophihabitans sp. TaxID=1610747 RepID=UPI0035CB9247
MTKQTAPGRMQGSGQGDGDPWAAFGYLAAGVAFYGVLGWLLGKWLNAEYLVAVGIVVGMLFGMYMVFARYRFHDDSGDVPTRTPIDHDSYATRRDDRDDRGDEQ